MSWPAASQETEKIAYHEGTKCTKEISGQDYMIKTIGGLESGPWEVLTAEMTRYEYEISPKGQVSYAALSGDHDDYVMGLAPGE